jgi:hypothetical protein
MKVILISSILGVLLSVVDCGKKDKPQNVINGNKLISEFFEGIDTTKQGISVGCSAGFWKLIDSNLVIRITPSITQMPYNRCMIINIDSTISNDITELFVFKKGEANIDYICMDIHGSKKEPVRSFPAISGQIIVELTDPTDYYGHIQPKVSILIKELIFIDPKTKKRIEIKNELLWKVLDFGHLG